MNNTMTKYTIAMIGIVMVGICVAWGMWQTFTLNERSVLTHGMHIDRADMLAMMAYLILTVCIAVIIWRVSARSVFNKHGVHSTYEAMDTLTRVIQNIGQQADAIVDAANHFPYAEFGTAWKTHMAPAAHDVIRQFDVLPAHQHASLRVTLLAFSIRNQFQLVLSAGNSYASVTAYLTEADPAVIQQVGVGGDEFEKLRCHWAAKLRSRHTSLQMLLEEFDTYVVA